MHFLLMSVEFQKSHTCEAGGAKPLYGAIFALLSHLWPKKSKFFKNVKIAWRYYRSALVYQKRQSHHLQFLRYSADTIFPHLGHFCPFTPFVAQKIKIFKKSKNYLEILLFCTSVPKITIISPVVPQIQSRQAFSSFWAILAFYPIWGPKKLKKTPGDIMVFHYLNVPKITIISPIVPQIE